MMQLGVGRAMLIGLAILAPFAAVACSETVLSNGATASGSATSSTSGATSSAGSSTATSSSGSSSSGAGGASSTSSSSSASSSASSSSTGAGGAPDDGGVDASDADVCGTLTVKFPIDPSPHVAICSPVTYSTNPPTSGPHYPIWAAYRSYATPVPRGFYVHALEHGAVVFLYNCPNGCAADVAALQTLLDGLAADPLCVAPVMNRFVVTPDPLLDVKFAVTAWGAWLRSDCMDLAAIQTFIAAHYAQGPENFCADGTDVTAADAGIPADCGEIPDAATD